MLAFWQAAPAQSCKAYQTQAFPPPQENGLRASARRCQGEGQSSPKVRAWGCCAEGAQCQEEEGMSQVFWGLQLDWKIKPGISDSRSWPMMSAQTVSAIQFVCGAKKLCTQRRAECVYAFSRLWGKYSSQPWCFFTTTSRRVSKWWLNSTSYYKYISFYPTHIGIQKVRSRKQDAHPRSKHTNNLAVFSGERYCKKNNADWTRMIMPHLLVNKPPQHNQETWWGYLPNK